MPKEDDHIHLGHDIPEMEHAGHINPVEKSREYVKFAVILLGIFVFSVAITTLRGWGGSRFGNDFIAVFFMTFAGFKFINLEEFALIYRTFDVIAQKIRPWGYAVPFIEVFLGISYFVSTDAWQINLLALLFTGTAGYGAYKALKRKPKSHCTSPGTFIKLPLTKVSFVENSAMFVMSAVMLFI